LHPGKTDLVFYKPKSSPKKFFHRRFVYENNEKRKQKNIFLLPLRAEQIATKDLMFIF